MPVLLEARRRLRAELRGGPALVAPSRLSFALELVPAHYPLERCWGCKAKIGVEKPGAMMWQRVEGSKIRYLHQECADEHGEPLVPQISVRLPPTS